VRTSKADMTHREERNQDATVYVGELDSRVSESLLWELMLQAGPVVNVYVPKDKLSQLHMGYGFVEFGTEEDADYAIKVMNMIKLWGKPIRVNKAKRDGRNVDVGANLFIGNLDPDVDEKLLYDTFSAFGVIISTPKIMRDPESAESKGFGFVSYDSFDASDAAIESLNNQFICNRPITVSYAIKKDSKTGERHGSPAERLLAASNPSRLLKNRPHTLFGTGPLHEMGMGMPQQQVQMQPPPFAMPPMPMMGMPGPMMGMYPPPFAMGGAPPFGYGMPQFAPQMMQQQPPQQAMGQ